MDIAASIVDYARHMTIYEIVGVVFGLWSVYLTMRARVLNWPIGIVSVVAFGILFFQIKLYADLSLQVFFFLTGLQGWWVWLYGGRTSVGAAELPMSQLTRKQIILLVPITVVSIAVIGYLFASYTDAHLPFWDATASGLSVVAQLLLVRKKIENWYLWIAVDLLSIGIYIYKDVYLTAILYVIYLLIATGGLLEWRRTLKSAVLETA